MAPRAVRLGVIAAVLALGLGFLGMSIGHQKNLLAKKTKVVAQEIDDLKTQTQYLYQKREAYEKVRNRLLAQASYVQYLNRTSWSKVLFEVAQELPQEMALTSFKFSESGRAQFKGEAFAMEKISEVMRSMEGSNILEESKFEYLREQDAQDQKLFAFGIMAKLKESQKVNENEQ